MLTQKNNIVALFDLREDTMSVHKMAGGNLLDMFLESGESAEDMLSIKTIIRNGTIHKFSKEIENDLRILPKKY